MSPRSIVIIGGGTIIGSSIAYYLARHPKIGTTTIYLVESSYIAAGSSGKGGGFIAKDWHGAATASLGALSFQLHAELAKEHNGAERWGYRRLVTLGLDSNARSTKKGKPVADAAWIRNVTGSIDRIGDETTTGQVHPFQLTNALVEDARGRGVNVVIGEATAVKFGDNGSPSQVAVLTDGKEELIPATDVVFAAGPWTGTLAKTLLGSRAGRAAEIVPSSKSTSIVVTPNEGRPITPHALFCTVILPDGSHAQPEIYPRPDNTLYVCGAGMTDNTPLPKKAADVQFSEEGVRRLKDRLLAVVNKEWVDKRVQEDDFTKQACYRPDSSRTHQPLIGKLGDGLWIASGHQVWGIALDPGTGKVMAELLMDGAATSADVSAILL